MGYAEENSGLGGSGILQKSISMWQQRRIAEAQEEASRQKETKAQPQQEKAERKKPAASPAAPADGAAAPSGPTLIRPSVDIGTKPSASASLQGGSGSIGPNALYSYLIDKGATRNQAIMLTGAAGAESRWNPTLSHDKGTGYGLWGHRAERWDAMSNMAGDRHPSWQKQADYALWELNNSKDGGIRRANAELAAATTPEQIARAQMHFERPVGYTPANPEGGHNYSGRLSLVRQIENGSFGGRATTPGSGGASPSTPMREAGSAQYAQANTGTATDARPPVTNPTTPAATTSPTTAPAAAPVTTPGSNLPTSTQPTAPGANVPTIAAPAGPAKIDPNTGKPVSGTDANPRIVSNPHDYNHGPPIPPDTTKTAPATAQPAAQQDQGWDIGKDIGGFFDSIFGTGEPIKDQYGRTWDGFQGWVDPPGGAKAQTSIAEKTNSGTTPTASASSDSGGVGGLMDSFKSIFDDSKNESSSSSSSPLGDGFSGALNFMSSIFG